MVVYGGANGSRQFNDVWNLDLDIFLWQELLPTRLSEPGPSVGAVEEQHFRVGTRSRPDRWALRGRPQVK